jgi:hypothetical protein
MLKRLRWFSVIAPLLLATSLHAQHSSVEPVITDCSLSSSAGTVLRSALIQQGIGQGQLNSRFSMTLTNPDGTTRSFKIWQLGKKMRIGNGMNSAVSDSHRAEIANGTHVIKLPMWVGEGRKPEHFPASYIALVVDDPGCKSQYLGKEAVGDSLNADHVRLWVETDDGTSPAVARMISEAEYWIDPQTRQVVKAKTYIFSPQIIDNRSPVEVYYSDFRRVGNATLPFKMSRYIEGKKAQDYSVDSVTFNAGNTDTDFDATAGGMQ